VAWLAIASAVLSAGNISVMADWRGSAPGDSHQHDDNYEEKKGKGVASFCLSGLWLPQLPVYKGSGLGTLEALRPLLQCALPHLL
jgi:hypothetical protein